MKTQKLMLAQLDEKLSIFKKGQNTTVPNKGWINGIRTTLNITLKQLSDKLATSPQNIRATEDREATGAVTLKALREVAGAMDMQLVYAIVPKDDSLEKLIERRATALAKSIVLRTSASMRLENQEIAADKLEKAIKDKTSEIIDEMPKYLWD